MLEWEIITGEYPPQSGGVGDYTRLIARELAAAGDSVRVWAPEVEYASPEDTGVVVRRLPGHFGQRALTMLQSELRPNGRPRRLLVQYVPHMYGWKAMNLPFALWLRYVCPTPPWVMFHEVAFPLAWRQSPVHNALGIVTRIMAGHIARSATRIFVSIPAWARLLRSIAPQCCRPEWLPIPSTVATTSSPAASAIIREKLGATDAFVLGHFGTFGGRIAGLLENVLPILLGSNSRRVALLVGRGGPDFMDRLTKEWPGLAGRVKATGELGPDEVAAHLSSCDLLVQPYVDGASSRRTTLMASLALGLPVVTTSGPLTERIWHEEKLAVLVPVGDVTALCVAVSRLEADAPARQLLAARAKAGYQTHFSVSRTVATHRQPATHNSGKRDI